MKRTTLLILVLCLVSTVFAQKPEGVLSYQAYPETGFEAWSFTEKNLPDEIYTADMCIVSECVGYFPCTAFIFSPFAISFLLFFQPGHLAPKA